jgi:hypothetical protein
MADESRLEEGRLEELARQYGRTAVARSKGRAVAVFRPATFEEYEAFTRLGGDEMLAMRALTQACTVAPGLAEISAMIEARPNLAFVAAGEVRKISGGDLVLDVTDDTVRVMSGETCILTCGVASFVEVQRYTADKTPKRLIAQRTYVLGATVGTNRDEAKALLDRYPAVIPRLAGVIEALAVGDYDFSGN